MPPRVPGSGSDWDRFAQPALYKARIMASERAHAAFSMRLGGATYSVIAGHLGVRPERARQLVIAAAREAIRRAPQARDRILDSVSVHGRVTRSGFPVPATCADGKAVDERPPPLRAPTENAEMRRVVSPARRW